LSGPTSALALALLLGACGNGDAPVHASGLAKRLLEHQDLHWQTYPTPHGHLHFRPGSYASRTTAQLSVDVEQARAQVLKFLQERDRGGGFELFFVDTRAQMQHLIGRPMAGMVEAGEKTALFVYNASYTPFLRHELTHLFTLYNWGKPPTGRWISEGLAALVQGNCQGHTIDELSAGLLADGSLRSWADLQSQFDQIPELVGNVEAASLVGFVKQQAGMKGVRDMWSGDRSYMRLEPQWRAYLRSLRPAHFNIEQLREHGCQDSAATSAGRTSTLDAAA